MSSIEFVGFVCVSDIVLFLFFLYVIYSDIIYLATSFFFYIFQEIWQI